MGTLVAAYSIVWLAVAVYVAWLGLQQRRLRRRVDALHDHVERATTERSARKAA
jgi:CcmD family protein